STRDWSSDVCSSDLADLVGRHVSCSQTLAFAAFTAINPFDFGTFGGMSFRLESSDGRRGGPQPASRERRVAPPAEQTPVEWTDPDQIHRGMSGVFRFEAP